jgi:hypothetical protein
MTDTTTTTGATTPAVGSPESPLAPARREAEDQQAIEEAKLKSAEARQKQLSALIPDLSKVTPGSLETKGETPLFGPSLAQRAAAAAAARAAKRVGETIGGALGSARVLVTSDADLATSDAVYVEVLSGLGGLIIAAEKLMADVEPATPAPAQETESFRAQFVGPALVPLVEALASALPGALSLLSAHRTLSTSPVTVDSFAAAAVVAGELSQKTPKPAIFHDDFRLLPEGGAVQDKVASLAEKRTELVGLKITLEDRKSTESARLGELKAEVKESEEKISEAKKADRDGLRPALDKLHGEVAECEVAVGECAVRVGLIDSTTDAIDKFTTSMQTTAAGATHSPLVAAILREQLHRDCGDAKKFTHVLLVKAEPGSAQQLVDDRPLMFKDKFTTIATATVSYMLIETTGGSVLRSGSIGGEAKVQGTVGKDISVVEAKAMAAPID